MQGTQSICKFRIIPINTKMKHLVIILVATLLSAPIYAGNTTKKKAPPKKTGTISKIKDSATRGFGWGLGREAAKETVKGVKNLTRKGVEKVKVVKNNTSADK